MSFSSSSSVCQVSQEEFNLFHSIDRRLFSILIFVLGKDPNDASQVMALWLWLERVHLKSTIITSIIELPYLTIDVLFMESMMCIDVAMYGPFVNGDIPILTSLLNTKKIDISLAYFHLKNTYVLHEISKIIDEVCFRAFKDLVDQLNAQRSGPLAGQASADGSSGSRNGLELGPLTSIGSSNNDDVNDFGAEVLKEIEEEVYGRMGLLNIIDETPKEEGKESRGRGSSNKTLFLTFSKGYPIHKIEVREFFQRTFGDVIEGIYMQDVGNKNEQPLYARVVLRDAVMMDLVLQGQQKVKYSINGKHVCVRKYVRKRSESPPTPPAQY